MQTSKLRTKRTELGLTQADLSKLSGIGISTIATLERGSVDQTKVGILKKLAEELGEDYIELFLR